MSGWFPAVGEAVVRVRNDRYNKSAIDDVVARIGKRDIVLESGERFRVRDLRQENGAGWSITYVQLMSPSDAFVDKLRSEIRHERKVRAARKACEDYLHRKADVTEYDVILALAPLSGLRDLVAAYDAEAKS